MQWRLDLSRRCGVRTVHSVLDLSFDGFESSTTSCQRILSLLDAWKIERDPARSIDALLWIISLSRREPWRRAGLRARVDGALAPRLWLWQLGLALVDLDDTITHFDILLLRLLFLQLVMEQFVPFSLLASPPFSGSAFPFF